MLLLLLEQARVAGEELPLFGCGWREIGLKRTG